MKQSRKKTEKGGTSSFAGKKKGEELNILKGKGETGGK